VVVLEREFDVSEAVAKKFGFIDAGTANLIATVLTNK
jgi:rare lipoprotein A (peptidoglycan hydrolase)